MTSFGDVFGEAKAKSCREGKLCSCEKGIEAYLVGNVDVLGVVLVVVDLEGLLADLGLEGCMGVG